MNERMPATHNAWNADIHSLKSCISIALGMCKIKNQTNTI